ncbi:MAG: glycosyltransferase family 4 protein [Alphaproteobacteria bacterium]
MQDAGAAARKALVDAAIFYVPDGYDTAGRQLMGRRAAGEAFLRALARNDDRRPLNCCAPDAEAFADFQRRVAGFGGPVRAARFIPVADRAGLGGVGTLFYPGPDIARLAWYRAGGDPSGYSVVGITHTTASHGAMDNLLALGQGGVEAWDAVICTSRAVRQTVDQVLGVAHEQARARGESPRPPAVRLPVIPLGVDCAGLAPGADAPSHRARFRGRLGIGADDLVVLSLARTSYHGKAHPLPMYLALQAVAQRPGRTAAVHLLQVGWFANEAIEQHFRAAAKALCPDVTVHFVAGTEPDVRRNVWHAADIFCLMSDNIQETFGLAPVEAMAAGLPVVATDWDGFRDTVRHGVDGFMARTAMPGPGAGEDLALRHDLGVDSYDRYIGGVSQTTAVSLGDAIAGFSALADNPDLRRTMGASGQERARTVFDWPVVIDQYRALWAELADRRARTDAPPASPRPPFPPPHPVNPARDDPYRLFAGYPTVPLTPETRMRTTPGMGPRNLQQRSALAMNSFSAAILPAAAGLDAMLRCIGRPGDHKAADAIAAAAVPVPLGLRGLGWLAKMGLAQIGDGNGGWM